MSYDTSHIQIISELEGVRERPGMYIGSTDDMSGVMHLIDELVSNALDQWLIGEARGVRVSLGEGLRLVVEDDGPGLPFDEPHEGRSLAEHVLTTLHTTATARGHAPHVHLHGVPGIGMAPINALCASLVCRAWRNGACWEQRFERGVALGAPEVVARGEGRGTRLELELDETLFGLHTLDGAQVRARLFEAAHLFAGCVMEYSAGAGAPLERFCSPRGLSDLLAIHEATTSFERHQWGARAPLWFQHHGERLHVNAAASGVCEEGATQWRTWANGMLTPLHGSHRRAFEAALQQVGWRPRMAMIHVVCKEPRYANPTKDELVIPDREEELTALLLEALVAYAPSPPREE